MKTKDALMAVGIAVAGVAAYWYFFMRETLEGTLVLELETVPDDVEVTVDDEPISLPLAISYGLKLSPGPHTLKVYGTDGEPLHLMFQYQFQIQTHMRTRLYMHGDGTCDETIETS